VPSGYPEVAEGACAKADTNSVLLLEASPAFSAAPQALPPTLQARAQLAMQALGSSLFKS